jgi:D-psicose/D-tagatose/L-ribulose 3-epimerase
VRGEDDNPMSPDPAVRAKGVAANQAVLDCCQAAGIETLVGPYHSALGYFSGQGATEDEWKWAVESMQQVAEHAEQCNVNLGLEYLNRFECYLLNTAEQAARFCRDVGHPRCKMMYDTFHAHIEEKSIPEAIRTAKDHLVHVHISENDRSTPGQGNVRWPENFDTLKEIGYDNLMVIEAFGLALERLVPATKIWRRMYESEKQLATDGLNFMKSEVAKRW